MIRTKKIPELLTFLEELDDEMVLAWRDSWTREFREKIGELKAYLMAVEQELEVFSPDDNFELGGSLTPGVMFMLQKEKNDLVLR